MYINELSIEPNQKLSVVSANKIGFYESIRWTLLACRFSGLLPISGLRHRDSRLTRCKLFNPYTILYVLFMVFQAAKLILRGYSTCKTSLTFTKSVNFLLDIITFVMILFHLSFARNWLKLLNSIEGIEKFLPPIKKSSVKKMNIIMVLLTIPCVVQYLLQSIVAAFTAANCFIVPGDSGLNLQSYAYVTSSWMYQIIPFDYFTAIMFQIARVQNTFMWNFTDTLIIIISIYLMTRFNAFNSAFEQKVVEIQSREEELPWNDFREHYTFLMKLVEVIDTHINGMIFLSYSNLIIIGKNLYTILSRQMKQLVLKSDCSSSALDFLSLFYYLYSVVLLFTRTMLVSNFAARINSLSRQPLYALYTISAPAYDTSFQRLMDQVYHSNVSLSGLRCFYVTRQMILTMLATLLTYEFVLLQSK